MANNVYFSCHVVGHLTCTPKLSYTKSGEEKSKFYLMVRQGFTPKGKKTHYDIYTFMAYGKVAGYINKYFLRKDLVNINCYPKQLTVKDESGKRNHITYFVVNNMSLLARDNKTPLVFMGDGAPLPELSDDDYTILFD